MQINMNSIQLIGLASVAGALLIAMTLIGISAVRRSRQMKRLLNSTDGMNNSIQSLQTELARVKEEANQNSLAQQTATFLCPREQTV